MITKIKGIFGQELLPYEVPPTFSVDQRVSQLWFRDNKVHVFVR